MRVAAVLLAMVCACSGDDSHRHSKTPQAPAATPGETQTEPALPGTPVAFSESAAQSYWTSPDEIEASQKFALEDYKAATEAFTRARAATTDEGRSARIDLMLGLSAERSNDATTASGYFLAAYAKLPQLSDYIGYHAARTLWLAQREASPRGDKGAEATGLAKKTSKDSIVGADAEILLGDLLRGTKDWSAVALHYRDYLARHPKGPFRSEARYELANAIEESKGDVNEAIGLYKQISIDDPLSSWTTKATAKLTGLKVNVTYSAAEHIPRGNVPFHNLPNPGGRAEVHTPLPAAAGDR